MMKDFLIFIIILTPLLAIGQNLSFSLETGYGFELNPMEISDGDIIHTVDNQIYVTKVSTIRHSYGEGLNIGGFIEYSINRNLEIGLGISFLKGKKEDRNLIDFDEEERIDLLYSNMLRLIPEMKLNLPIKKNILYTRVGLIVGLGGKVIEDRNSNDRDNWSRSIKSGGNSFGIMSGVGYRINITKRLSVSAEVRAYSQTFGPKEHEKTIAIQDGENIVESLQPWYRYGHYVNEFESTYTSSGVDISKPWIATKRFYSFSSVGINLSVIYTIMRDK